VSARTPTQQATASPSSSSAVVAQVPPPYRRDIVQIEMKNVRLHVADDIVLDIASLRGEMVSRSRDRPPVFDDQESYILHVDTAEISMDMSSLTAVMNRHIAYDDAPLKNLGVEVADDGRLQIKGSLHKGIDMPFSSKARVAASDDGRLRLHVESFKAIGVPAKGLLGLFGLELDDLVALKRSRDITIEENDIVISPGEALPPPEIRGHLSRVMVAGGKLVQTFASPGRRRASLRPPDPLAPNYVYFAGGDIRFGKLTMSRADLQLIDLDRGDVFDFFPAHYDTQLVAGYSKNTPQKGLKTYMPDYNDLTRSARARAPLPSGR